MDGVTWQRLDADSLPPVDTIVLVGASGGQFLAMGEVAYCPTYCQSFDWYLMTSSDGISWSVLGQLPGEPNMISTVFDSSFGYFAGGSAEPAGVVGPVGIWSSTNGAHWTSLSDETTFHDGSCGPRRGEIFQFYATSSGLAASGTSRWVTDDGKHWRCAGDQLLWQVAHGNAGYVGVGDGPGESATLWSSADGISWSQSQAVPVSVDIGAVADGFVAAGDPPLTSTQRLFLTSSDGSHWADGAYPFGSQVGWGLTSDGTRAAAFSASQNGDLWLSSSSGTTWTRCQLPIGESDEIADEVALLGNTVVVSGDSKLGGPVLWVAQIP